MFNYKYLNEKVNVCGSPGGIKLLDLEFANHAAGFITFRENSAVSLNARDVTPTRPVLVTVSQVLIFQLFICRAEKSLIWKGIPGEHGGVNHSLQCRFKKPPKLGILSFLCPLRSPFSLTWRLRMAQRGDKRLHTERWMASFRFGWHRVG